MYEWKRRYRRWLKWRKQNRNSKVYQVMVLLGIVKSPTFQWYI